VADQFEFLPSYGRGSLPINVALPANSDHRPQIKSGSHPANYPDRPKPVSSAS